MSYNAAYCIANVPVAVLPPLIKIWNGSFVGSVGQGNLSS